MSLLKTTPVAVGADGGAVKPVKKLKDNDRVVKHILTALALVSVAIIIFIIAFTLYNSWDAPSPRSASLNSYSELRGSPDRRSTAPPP